MMANSPGLPKRPEPSSRETAAACVGLADLVTGLFQFDSVDGVADDGDALGMVVLGGSDGVSSAGGTVGSGASVGTGAGAAGTGGAGSGGGVIGATGGVSVGLPLFPSSGEGF